MNTKSANKRKRILFIHRDCGSDTPGAYFNRCIPAELRQHYDVVTYVNLDCHVIVLVRNALTKNKFEALITHVPYSASAKDIRPCSLSYISELITTGEAYKESLGILREIKKIDDIPIIAYTGAGGSLAVNIVFTATGEIDHIVHKSIYPDKDLKELQDTLERLFQKYQAKPQLIPAPQLSTQAGNTTTKVTINLNGGFGLSSITRISTECKTFPKAVVFKKSGGSEDKEIFNAKNIMEILMMGEALMM